jgi:hypothetical protein
LVPGISPEVKDGPPDPRAPFSFTDPGVKLDKKGRFWAMCRICIMYGLFSFSFPTGARASCPRRPTYLGRGEDLVDCRLSTIGQ